MNFFDFIFERKNIILIISLIINGLLICISGYFGYSLFTYECEACNQDNLVLSDNENDNQMKSKWYVDIKGAVKNPGVYEISKENIINDIIKLAGGFSKNAYKNNINLSKKVSDELVIYVYSKSEYQKLNKEEEKIVECNCPTYDISDCTSNGSSIIVNDNLEPSNNIMEDSNNSLIVDDKNEDNSKKLININTASLEELTTLNGIGESKAKAIIEYRNKTKFQTIEDIKNISGIGDKAFEKIKDYITV